MYYAHIRNNELLDVSACKYLDEDITNIEVTEDVLNNLNWYEWNGTDIVKKTDEVIQQELEESRETEFKKNFFETSLGWVRREVTMADGNVKNFLSDLYPTILTMVNNGVSVPLLVYKEPDYTNELTNDYMVTLQKQVTATSEFVTECGNQLLADFQG